MAGRHFIMLVVLATTGLVAAAKLPYGYLPSENSKVWTAPADAAARVNPLPADEIHVQTGKTTYVRLCDACHGEAGRGNGVLADILDVPPGDLGVACRAGVQSDGALFWKITTGRGPMQSYEQVTTEEQRWQLIHYLRTLAVPAPAAPPEAPPKTPPADPPAKAPPKK